MTLPRVTVGDVGRYGASLGRRVHGVEPPQYAPGERVCIVGAVFWNIVEGRGEHPPDQFRREQELYVRTHTMLFRNAQ
jgi:hypothetical protein